MYSYDGVTQVCMDYSLFLWLNYLILCFISCRYLRLFVEDTKMTVSELQYLDRFLPNLERCKIYVRSNTVRKLFKLTKICQFCVEIRQTFGTGSDFLRLLWGKIVAFPLLRCLTLHNQNLWEMFGIVSPCWSAFKSLEKLGFIGSTTVRLEFTLAFHAQSVNKRVKMFYEGMGKLSNLKVLKFVPNAGYMLQFCQIEDVHQKFACLRELSLSIQVHCDMSVGRWSKSSYFNIGDDDAVEMFNPSKPYIIDLPLLEKLTFRVDARAGLSYSQEKTYISDYFSSLACQE